MALNEKLRKLWKAAGYDRGHGSDAVLPPAPKGFKRLYYLTGPEHAISNIVFSRLKISRFPELNDPFELLGQNFSNKAVRKLIRDHRDSLNDKIGMVCFSEDWTDPVLWGHYAAKHRGVALGFDVKDSLVEKVQYSSQRLKQKIPLGAKAITPKMKDLLLYTKFESWSYEREWRLVHELDEAESEGSLYFLPISKTVKLVEVILGSLCDLDLPKMRKLVNSHHAGAMTYKARLAYKSFRIIPSGITVVQPS